MSLCMIRVIFFLICSSDVKNKLIKQYHIKELLLLLIYELNYCRMDKSQTFYYYRGKKKNILKNKKNQSEKYQNNKID